MKLHQSEIRCCTNIKRASEKKLLVLHKKKCRRIELVTEKTHSIKQGPPSCLFTSDSGGGGRIKIKNRSEKLFSDTA